MTDAPPQEERPNVRVGEHGQVVVDLKDDLSIEEEMERLEHILFIIKNSEDVEEAQERVNERYSDE